MAIGNYDHFSTMCHVLAPKEQFTCSNRFLERFLHTNGKKGTFQFHAHLYLPKRTKLSVFQLGEVEMFLQGPLQSSKSLLSYRNHPALAIS